MRLKLLIGVAISGLCLYFVFRGLSIRDIAAAMRTADPRWIIAALMVYAVEFLIRSFRWEVLIRPVKPIPATQLLSPMIIGFFANNVLPFRMGEVVRAHVTGQKFKISRTASLGTIVLERIFDTISFLTIFLSVTFFYPFPAAVKHGAYVLGVGCAGLITALVLASKNQTLAHRLILKTPLPHAWREKVQHVLVNFTHGVSGMMQGSYVIQALLLSMIVWTLEGTTLFLITRSFPVHITYPQAFFLLFFLGLSVTLPQAPGYVGTIELFGVMALTLLGIAKNMALSMVLTIHACQFMFVAALGGWALWKENISLARLVSDEEQTL